MAQDTQKLEKSLKLAPPGSYDAVVLALARDIFSTLNNASEVFRAKEREVLEKLGGGVSGEIPPALLVGWKGEFVNQSKAFRDAGKIVAGLLGMDFLEGVMLDRVDVINPFRHFAFVEFQASKLNLTKLLSSAQKDDLSHTQSLLVHRLDKASRSHGSIVAMTEVLGTPVNIQNVVCALAENKQVGRMDFAKSYIGLCGELEDNGQLLSVPVVMKNRMKLLIQPDQTNLELRKVMGDRSLVSMQNDVAGKMRA